MIVELSYGIFAASVLAGVFILLCCWVVWGIGRLKGFWGGFLLGWAVEVLLSLPAGIWQSFSGWGYMNISFKGKFVVPLAGWFFNAAGFSVRSSIFSVDSWWGNRPVVYFGLGVLQCIIFAFLFAIRYKRRDSIKDVVVLLLVIIFLVNSLANVRWEWFPPG